MRSLLVVVLFCLLAACVLGVGTLAQLGYSHVKAGFNIGNSEFYIEADNLSRRPSSESGGVFPGSDDIVDRVSEPTR